MWSPRNSSGRTKNVTSNGVVNGLDAFRQLSQCVSQRTSVNRPGADSLRDGGGAGRVGGLVAVESRFERDGRVDADVSDEVDAGDEVHREEARIVKND